LLISLAHAWDVSTLHTHTHTQVITPPAFFHLQVHGNYKGTLAGLPTDAKYSDMSVFPVSKDALVITAYEVVGAVAAEKYPVYIWQSGSVSAACHNSLSNRIVYQLQVFFLLFFPSVYGLHTDNLTPVRASAFTNSS
jgi:hypothetical protein